MIRRLIQLVIVMALAGNVHGQDNQGEARTIADAVVASEIDPDWILPADGTSPALWGIRDGIIFSLWPTAVGSNLEGTTGGPRGLIRVGYNFKDASYLINFIAVEPIVDGDIEFSEISPSLVDEKLGKVMWAGDSDEPGRYYPSAITRGTITRPDPERPDVQELSLYIFMEKFLSGAHPYLRITLRNDRREEIGLEVFHQDGSVSMERCTLTATMGNYSRVRYLYLRDRVVDARELYRGYDDVHFVEKESYPVEELLRDGNGDIIAIVEPSESFSELASWPQETKYYDKRWWRYRPFFKVTQYWRKEAESYDPSLRVRVNGRGKYYSGSAIDPEAYVDIPGGLSFENFEMREDYYPGQKFYFGITRQKPSEMNVDLTSNN